MNSWHGRVLPPLAHYHFPSHINISTHWSPDPRTILVAGLCRTGTLGYVNTRGQWQRADLLLQRLEILIIVDRWEGDVGQNKFHFQELRTEMTYEWPRQFQAPCDGYLHLIQICFLQFKMTKNLGSRVKINAVFFRMY